MNYAQRVEREDEGDRIRAFLDAETDASDAAIRGAFRVTALGILEWRDAGELTAAEYRRLEGITGSGNVYRPYDPQGDVEPYDVEADWREHA